jgi:hypothetical protein
MNMKTSLNIILWILFSLILMQVWNAASITVPITTDLSFINGCGATSCTVQSGFWVVQDVMGGIIKYFTYLAGLGSVLFIVINWVLYSMAGINEGMKWAAKERIQKTLIWLVILMLSWVILNAIAPWIYK